MERREGVPEQHRVNTFPGGEEMVAMRAWEG